MGELARWNLKVSKELDIDLRMFLAERGGKKGDLSAFVERAVARALLQQTVQAIHEDNADLSEEEAMEIANAEIAAFRQENPGFWDRDRWATA